MKRRKEELVHVTVRIPKELYEKIEEILENRQENGLLNVSMADVHRELLYIGVKNFKPVQATA